MEIMDNKPNLHESVSCACAGGMDKWIPFRYSSLSFPILTSSEAFFVSFFSDPTKAAEVTRKTLVLESLFPVKVLDASLPERTTLVSLCLKTNLEEDVAVLTVELV